MPRAASAFAASSMKRLRCPPPAPGARTRAATARSLGYTDSISRRRMMTRSRAVVVAALPVAFALNVAPARLRAKEATPQPTASRSGVDLAALNRAVNPCDDFYKFACGGWMTAHPAPPDQPRYGRFE